MFISIPKEFFVPVLFSEEFRYNFETDSMEYDTERKTSDFSVPNSRAKLADIEYSISRNSRGEIEEVLKSELKNIEEEIIEEQIANYIKGFMRYMEELREAGCLDMSERERLKLLNSYVRKFRELYNNYKNVISNIRRPLSKSDIDGMIDYYIGKIEDIYNQHLASLNCKNLNYNSIEKTINEVVNDAKDILKEQIKNLNCKLINKEEFCKNDKELKESFAHDSDMYNTIDNEFVQEIQNKNSRFIEENQFVRVIKKNRLIDNESIDTKFIENNNFIVDNNLIKESENEIGNNNFIKESEIEEKNINIEERDTTITENKAEEDNNIEAENNVEEENKIIEGNEDLQ
ncbi:hypothetical protein NSA50_15375 [Clostridium sp. DSM 100503]|uniref:hypothetical protein n=1 Tax=Clostridium sp. DSM 100503 TaxID=2963282 RepID=UPI00214A6528|nr:hypothetical protein [Clostridium sp. DSM 100503]MCR1952409.1 hypothetical protein [Clostridium sp. DSM 100503]